VPIAELVPLERGREESWEEKKRRLGIVPARKDPLAIWDRPKMEPKARKPGDPTVDEILDELREDRI
jgi:hypothetical protein